LSPKSPTAPVKAGLARNFSVCEPKSAILTIALWAGA
jgi:hypothetical protein